MFYYHKSTSKVYCATFKRPLLYALVILLAVSVLPVLVFAQNQPPQQLPALEVPDSLEEAKEQSFSVAGKIASALPNAVKNIWETQILPFWRSMWEWTQKELWQKNLQPKVQDLIDKGKVILGREVEQRRPIIEQELEQEKQELSDELKTHAENAGKSIWERFKDLFRKN